MPLSLTAAVICVLTLTFMEGSALAQAPDGRDSGRPAGIDAVSIISEDGDDAAIRITRDLASVLDSVALRILPIVGGNQLKNLSDILSLREIDAGIVRSDLLEYAEREQLFPGTKTSARYITKLYNEEIHILARQEITDIASLSGRKVNLGLRGGSTSVTASLVFDALNVRIEPLFLDQRQALEKLRRGELAALVLVAGKPARLFYDLNQGDGVHFLPVPPIPVLLGTYQPARLGIQDYPLLIGQGEAGRGQAIETLGVSTVLAVKDQPPGTQRYRKLVRFVDALFSRLSALQSSSYDRKWKEVEPSSRVPGWTRFAPADAWLRGEPVKLDNTTNRLLKPKPRSPKPSDEQLFEEFLRSQQEQKSQ
jgi:uncharacterized protein